MRTSVLRVLRILCAFCAFYLGGLAMTSNAVAKPNKKQWAAAEAALRDHFKAQSRGILDVGQEPIATLGTAFWVRWEAGGGGLVLVRDKDVFATKDMATITGQKPLITKSKQAISAFRLRQGMDIGCKVTLRGTRMYEFLDRLISLALPRVRDFRGLNPRSFDGRGNFALGLKEHIVFPEIDYDQVAEIWGMDVIVCTTAASDDEARALLRGFNFPFRN